MSVREVVRVSISTAAGDLTIATPRSDQIVRLLSYVLCISSAGTVRWENGAGGAALSGVMSLASSTPLVCPHDDNAWLETTRGTALSLEATGTLITGHANVEYVNRPPIT